MIKMNIRTSTLCATALLPLCAAADITVNFAQPPLSDKIISTYTLISDITDGSGRRNIPTVTDTVAINGMTAQIPVTAAGNARYNLHLAGTPANSRGNIVDFYTSPGDNIAVDILSSNPLVAEISGTPLMDGINCLQKQLAPIEEKVSQIQKGLLPESEFPALAASYDKVLADFIDSNPDNPASVYALISIDDDRFFEYEKKLSPSLSSSPLFPFIKEDKNQRLEKQRIEQQKKQLTSGNVSAPDFTLNDADGKPVTLSQFHGKWVVLDFWGSWCMWCIKGFPALKDAYKKYEGKLEIIGIDCGDTPETWRTAIKKYALPWINVYNPSTPGNLTEIYPVQGFPTKIIISPEGKIIDMVTGENPAFFTALDSLIK